ncbi:MAG TPA: RNA 2',3'-cyclic phosphodiesterase [Candidatus Binatia bacterium]|nr:RNA 2',3'-cyclic phosphodiesterase [Candidatus Binatia bacterium]
MIRAFIGVQIASEVRARISQAIAQLAAEISGIRWVREENFHFTLKFLGLVEEPQIEPIGNALAQAIHPFRRFTISAKCLGVFPDIKRARILWVGLEGNDMAALAKSVESVLEPVGFPRENRIFRPHLTVGRWRHPMESQQELGGTFKRWKNVEFGESAVDEVVLFQSVLKPDGAVYRPLKAVPLAKD